MKTEWSKLVTEKFRAGRLINPKYSLMQAMKAAKQVYKKSAPVVQKFTRKLSGMGKKRTGKKRTGKKRTGKKRTGRRRTGKKR